MNSFSRNIEENFQEIDLALIKIPETTLLYSFLFSIRTPYSVVDELMLHKKEITFLYELKNLFKILGLIVIYPFTKIVIDKKNDTIILGNWRFDRELSKELNIPQLNFRRKFTIKNISSFKDIFVIVKNILLLFSILKKKRKLIRCIPSLINFYKIYSEIDLRDVKIIIAEDDLNAVHVGILLKAKENNIVRIKIEYVQIDYLQHNNVFADYYFYPSTYHKNIRQNCSYNSKLKYITGGYLNTSFLQYDDIGDVDRLKINIVFFTAHSNLFDRDDLYYINEILTSMSKDNYLIIKVHPYDFPSKYEHLKENPQVKIYKFGEIANLDLIRNAQICISMFSAVSLEAKSICNNSFFINYSFDKSCFAKDYKELNSFFDTISSRKMLLDVLESKYQPKSDILFKQNINLTHPDTFKIFQEFLNKIKSTL